MEEGFEEIEVKSVAIRRPDRSIHIFSGRRDDAAGSSGQVPDPKRRVAELAHHRRRDARAIGRNPNRAIDCRFGKLGELFARGIHPKVAIAVRARAQLVEQHALCRNGNHGQRGDFVGCDLIDDGYWIARNLAARRVELPGEKRAVAHCQQTPEAYCAP